MFELPSSYLISVARWKLRKRSPRLPLSIVRRGSSLAAIVIHERDSLCLSQIFPIYYYRRLIENHFGLRLFFQFKDEFLADPESSKSGAALVLLQAWYTTPEATFQRLLSILRTLNPSAKFVFFDAMSPTDLRLAHILFDKVDLYVKKHVLKDRSLYGKPTRGDTTLTDFYLRRYGLVAPDVTHEVPRGFLDKLLVGPSFFTAPQMLGKFKFQRGVNHECRTIDVHGRMSYNETDWYGSMRKEARSALERIQDIVSVTQPTVNPRQFFTELRASKVCVSPFGYGEACFRDFEAILGGSLLLKPDMAHIETDPDIFVPYQTYVPLDWLLSDLEEKVRYYLRSEGERRMLVDTAYSVLHEYCRSDQFVGHMSRVFQCT